MLCVCAVDDEDEPQEFDVDHDGKAYHTDPYRCAHAYNDALCVLFGTALVQFTEMCVFVALRL